MQRGRAVLLQRPAMFGGSVALVLGESVLRVPAVELTHQAIAVDLGDDRSGGDRQAERIAVEQLGLRAGMIDQHCVQDDVVGGRGQRLHRTEHGQACGVIDVNSVDGFGVDLGHADREGRAANAPIEAFALLTGQLLGVFEAHAHENCILGRQDDRRGHDRAEECTAANLVHAGDDSVTTVAESLLGGVSALQLLEHLLLGGCLGKAGHGGNLEELRHLYAPVYGKEGGQNREETLPQSEEWAA